MFNAYTTAPISQNGEGKTPLEKFIDRANSAGISTKETGSGGDDWEVVDGAKAKKIAEDAEDKEWYLVKKAEGVKNIGKKMDDNN